MEEKSFYSRQIMVDEIGLSGQQKLSDASVLVIGAGGLGCPVLQYIAAAGVGHIGIMDGDTVELSNLHRQILFSIETIGKNKSDEALKVLKRLNPFIEITSFPYTITTENALSIMHEYEIIVDCTDNYETRFLINDACVLLNKPLIYGAIYRFEGQVSVFNYRNGPTYRCLYPEMPRKESTTNCATSGVIGVLPGIIGLLQANEVLKVITGYGEVLSGKIMVYSAQKNSFDNYSLSRNLDFDYSTIFHHNSPQADRYKSTCSTKIPQQSTIDHLTLLQSAQTGEYLILDVRNPDEHPLFSAEGVIQIPLNELASNLNKLAGYKKIAFVCKSGIRGQKAMELVKKELNLEDLKNLENGITQQFITAWKSKKKH